MLPLWGGLGLAMVRSGSSLLWWPRIRGEAYAGDLDTRERNSKLPPC